MAKITPIYKQDDTKLFSNYQPVSRLLCFSKFKNESCLTDVFNISMHMKSLMTNNLGFV